MSVPADLEIEKLNTHTLMDLLIHACHDGELARAQAIASEMCRVERKGSCAVAAPDAAVYPALRVYTKEQLQPLQDRLDQYNSFQDE